MSKEKTKIFWVSLLFCTFCLFSNSSISQTFIRGYDNDFSKETRDGGSSLIKSKENNKLNYVVAGFTNEILNYDPPDDSSEALITKISGDSSELLWSKRIFPEDQHKQIKARGIVKENGPNFVFCGNAPSPHGDANILLGKLNADGTKEFLYNYSISSGPISGDIPEGATDLIIDDHGNYVLTGRTYFSDPDEGDIFIASFEPDGNPIEAKTLGAEDVKEAGTALIQNKNNDYLILGESEKGIVLSKYDSAGDFINAIIIKPTDNTKIHGKDIIETNSGYLIIGSKALSKYKGEAVLTLKINSSINDFVWAKCFDFVTDSIDYKSDQGRSVLTNNDKIIITGSTESFGGSKNLPDIFSLRLNEEGRFENLLVPQYDLMPRRDISNSIVSVNTDEGPRYTITGLTNGVDTYSLTRNNSDLLLSTFDFSNQNCFVSEQPAIIEFQPVIESFVQSKNAELERYKNILIENIELKKNTICSYDTTGIDRNNCSLYPEQYKLYQNYPNPFNPNTTIKYSLPERSTVKISIYNINGKKIRTLTNTRQKPGYHTVTWNASEVGSGVYFYRFTAGNITKVKKCVFIK